MKINLFKKRNEKDKKTILIRNRNLNAWNNDFADSNSICRYCPHNHVEHLVRSGQPHFYDSFGKRKNISKDVEIIQAFCVKCAQDIGTYQVLCYNRTTAIGETIPNRL